MATEPGGRVQPVNRVQGAALVLVAAMIGPAATQGAHEPGATASLGARVRPGVSHATARGQGVGAHHPGRNRYASGTPTQPAEPSRERGEASWGYLTGHVVTRYPRGTAIRVCGPLGCWPSATTWGASWGYGPARRTGRIVDLDRSVFAAICGNPRQGVCQVVLEVGP
jgi:hypothetical protein